MKLYIIDSKQVDFSHASLSEPMNRSEEPLENKLRGFILETRETRTGQLQELTGVRMNLVVKARQNLIDEGFLIQEGISVKIKEDTL